MTEPADDDSHVVAAMRLSGRRFDAAGVPAESLVEISAFADILRSLVTLYWRDRHPATKRIPKGYSERIELRLVRKLGEGSTRATLEYDLGPVVDMYAEDELEQDYERALKTVEEFIESALNGSGQVPADIRRLPANKVKRLGHTMRSGDAIQVAHTDAVEWTSVPQYTITARANAIENLDVETRHRTSVRGKVVDFHVLSGTLTVRDREHKRDITVPYREAGVAVEIASARQLFECEAEGIGEFNADGRLTRLAAVDTLNVIDVTEDARVARALLDNIAQLESGWVDGESGESIHLSVIERGHAVIDAMIALSNITRTVVPTEEGGVSFYWPEAENQLSIEVEPSGALYVHATNLSAGTFADAKVAADDDDLVEALDSWLSEVAGE